jgi:predicted CXXCH cytochrome family protein
VKPFAEVDDQVCGSCHSRGTSPEGIHFPASYRPGDRLSEHFTQATGSDVRWPDGSAKLNNQQYSDWHLGNNMLDSGDVTCTTCHSVHDAGLAQHQLTKPLNDLCLQCHDQQKSLIEHVPFHEQAIVNKRHEFTCADCHMPEIASSAGGFDIRSHAFSQPNPQGTVDHGGLAAMPNACNNCHKDLGEDPEWAAQTIAYSKEIAKSQTVSFFGPGPTPTSPPPPTPISVVGQPAPEEKPGLGEWLRPALISAFWLFVALMLYFIYTIIRSWRVKNA